MKSALQWPSGQSFLTPDTMQDIHSRCEEGFRAVCADLRIDVDLGPYLESLYLPLAAWLNHQHEHQGGMLVVGLCGGQGSGKSTVSALLQAVLTDGFARRVATLSIDDIYKTRPSREALAQSEHPLFVTRGVPMTHDVALGINVIEALRTQGEGCATRLPAFDKSIDTRKPEASWPVRAGPIDMVLFEGWCVGAIPQSEDELQTPINALEADEDTQAFWRTRVNKALHGEYAQLFSLIDVQLLLQVPSMEQVFEWRRLQEHKLAARVAEDGDNSPGLAVMSDLQVDRFIMHYERLTRHILREMPQRADIVLRLDQTHNPCEVVINSPL